MEINLSIDPEEVCIIIKDFIKTYVTNAGCTKVVIGLSGGIDSAVVALLCSEALGRKNTSCLFMPTDTTHKKDREDYQLLVKQFHLNSKEIDLTTITNDYANLFTRKLTRLAYANMKARFRMITLYGHANMNNSLVCGTSNKSEFLIGYFTKYGDGGVDFQPIGDIYKTQVYELAHFLKIPDTIINKPPMAGLIQNQTDEQDLGLNYNALDKILYGLECKLDDKIIAKAAKVKLAEVMRIKNMRKKSQHKRRSPLVAKIGIRTPGMDWRAPVQEG